MKCPKCGVGPLIYYEKMRHSYDQYHCEDGDAWTIDKNYWGGKIKYCGECCADITKFIKARKEKP